MPLYRVTWEIDIEERSPRAAAQHALEVQRDGDSIATVFDVQPHGPPRRAWTVDLTEGDCYPWRPLRGVGIGAGILQNDRAPEASIAARMRRRAAWIVPCPTCKAAAQSHCVITRGKTIGERKHDTHKARVRVATAKEKRSNDHGQKTNAART